MIGAILQARVSSSRLPGKVLKPILERPMLVRQIERISRARRFDRLIVATSTDSDDDAIEALCQALGVNVYRGPLDDVLARYHGAAGAFGCDHIVRLTGDCPLADPTLIDDLIELHLDGRFDYSSTGIEPSFPDGLDAEIMTRAALETAHAQARLPSEREHVTLFLYEHPADFRIGSLTGGRDLSHLRWTVDEPEDFTFVTRVYEALYPSDPGFGTDDILALLDRQPELAQINARFERNEGLRRSRQRDQAFLATGGERR